MDLQREVMIYLQKYEQNIIESCKNIKNGYENHGGVFDAAFETFLKSVLQNR